MSQNSNTTEIERDSVHHSKPIPISTQHLRHRSASFSSDSSNSPVSSPPLVTPNTFTNARIPVSSSSPILYFLSQSPSKSPATFPFRGFAPPPLIEDEEPEDLRPPPHARRASVSTANRFPPQLPVTEPHHERGVNVLRRLSLGGSLGKSSPMSDIPQPGRPQSPKKFVAPNQSAPNNNRKSRRSATISGQTRSRRAPSPMGERILKGHFDGFN